MLDGQEFLPLVGQGVLYHTLRLNYDEQSPDALLFFPLQFLLWLVIGNETIDKIQLGDVIYLNYSFTL